MGYQIQTNAPQIKAGNGATYAIGAFDWQNPAGDFYKLGIYSLDSVQGWIEVEAITFSAGGVLAAIQQNGSLEKSMEQTKLYINGLFQKHCQPPAPPAEPTTDAEAKVAITNSVNELKLVLVNGVPVLQ